MSYLDDKYIGLISPRLEKFKKIRGGVYTFRCPYCGDSQKHKNKTRGYFYQNKSDYNFKCHNCGMTRSFTYFLKDRDQPLYDEYIMERFKSGLTGKGTVAPEPEFKFTPPKFKKKNICDDLEKISALNTTHPAKTYLINRGIKGDHLHKFYYCPNFKEWTNKGKKIFRSIDNDDARIIIPLKDSDGNLFGYQGRSLDPRSKMRYITVMLEEGSPKIYGLDTINKKLPVYVVEGPFDSLFVPNSIAMCGSDVDLRSLNCEFVYVFDNEPRNKEIIERISRCIDQGQRVVIWPTSIEEKDVNDMILADYDIRSIIKENTHSDLTAKLKLNLWKKI